MKNQTPRKKIWAVRETAIKDKISEPQSPRLSNQRWTFAIVTLAGLALAGGCATERNAEYSALPTTGYVEPVPPPAPEKRAQANIVVPLHQESITVEKREVDAGAVRLKKIVKTETANQPVELRHEEVVIDREPGTGEAASNKALAKPFQEEETVIPLKREEAVVEKQMKPAGQIVVRTRSTADQTNIQAQVRREDIDVAQLNNAPNVILGQNVRSSAAVGGAETPGGKASGAASSSERLEIITDPATLPSDNAATFTGRPVCFRDMKVRKVVGDRLMVISTDNGRPLYAVCSEKTAAAHPGEVVVITGKIRQRASTSTETGLDVKGSQLMMAQPYYIEVEKIETAPK